MKRLFFFTTICVAIFLVVITVAFHLFSINHPVHKNVMGTTTKTTPAPVKHSVEGTITATPAALPKKKSYSVVLIGDSMIDTMGENVDYLDKSLKERYPQTRFTLYNYGIGGQNVQQGLDRFDSNFTYSTRNFPPIPQVHPDIIIIGSFAYNPFTPYDRDKHWITLKQLINKAKEVSSSVYILAEIAPLKENFGKGPHGVNWPSEMTVTVAREITELLDNAVALGGELGVPVINMYYSTQAFGNYGSGAYTNTDDGIHPSIAGHTFMADMIAKTLKL